jgi:hypothetical protein
LPFQLYRMIYFNFLILAAFHAKFVALIFIFYMEIGCGGSTPFCNVIFMILSNFQLLEDLLVVYMLRNGLPL